MKAFFVSVLILIALSVGMVAGYKIRGEDCIREETIRRAELTAAITRQWVAVANDAQDRAYQKGLRADSKTAYSQGFQACQNQF